jgi:hypothetical protein
MIKPLRFLFLVLIIAFVISGCVPGSPTTLPTQAETPFSPTVIPPTSTLTPAPIKTATLYPPATLMPEKAKETIQTLLKAPVDCLAPCFWGMTPGKTTLDEARNIFVHLGLQMASSTADGKDFSGVAHKFDSGLSIHVILTIQNDFVENLRVNILPEKQKKGIPREWLAYSPETLIKRYGPPTKVEFTIAWGPSTSSLFVMVMYFDTIDLIIEYSGDNIIPWQQKGSPQVCPLGAQFDIVRIWMGKDPVYPPAHVVPLEKATSLTLEEFSKLLMAGTPEKACINLKGEMFP